MREGRKRRIQKGLFEADDGQGWRGAPEVQAFQSVCRHLCPPHQSKSTQYHRNG